MRIPLSAPDINQDDIDAVNAVLRTPHLSLGPKLVEFEDAIARYVGAPHAIGVSSGTAGLHLCIRALGIAEGDEVIVPSFTFIAVANAVSYEKAIPVFVDIEPETLNLDPSRIEPAITPRTKAILVVHTFGCPTDMHAILQIARRHHLFVIEDACESIGAEFDGRKVGTWGDAGVFAFYPNKQITTGEGGMVVTHNPRIARTIRALRNQGRADTNSHLASGTREGTASHSQAEEKLQPRHSERSPRSEESLFSWVSAASLAVPKSSGNSGVLTPEVRGQAASNVHETASGDWFQHSEIGYNYRLPEMSCALGISQLKRLEAILQQREEIAASYHDKLKGVAGLKLPPMEVPHRKLSWFVFVVRLSEKFSQIHRDWIVSEMHRRGIECGRYFAPIHLQPAYRSATVSQANLPVTESESSRCLALPFFNRLQDEQIYEVCENLGELLQLASNNSTEELSANLSPNVLSQNSPD
jgi:dTDP-4-amino-4,6-dideoxygalactose transaminase